jgi:hypothetical protein
MGFDTGGIRVLFRIFAQIDAKRLCIGGSYGPVSANESRYQSQP